MFVIEKGSAMASLSPMAPMAGATPPIAKRRGVANLPPAQRSSLARIGAYALHAQYDARTTTQKARETKLARWQAQVDPTGELAQRDPDELKRRVKACQALEMEKVRFAKMRKAQARKEEEARQQQKQKRTSKETDATSVSAEMASEHSPMEQTVTKALGGKAIVARRPGKTASKRGHDDAGTTASRARNSKKAANNHHGDSHTTPHTH
jgi:hypothetical protein